MNLVRIGPIEGVASVPLESVVAAVVVSEERESLKEEVAVIRGKVRIYWHQLDLRGTVTVGASYLTVVPTGT